MVFKLYHHLCPAKAVARQLYKWSSYHYKNGRNRKARRVGNPKLIYMPDNSVSLHRVLKASPEKVYRAFTEANAMASWLPPYGFLCTVHEMNVKVGGSFKMSFHNFSTGNGHSFGGKYVELKPNEFLKYTDQFDDPNLPGEMTTSVWLKKVSAGTEIKIVQEGIPSMIPVEMCYLGWQESLEKLTKLVEPEIPDA
jgi:uncharacterized protein YndB with AHSA1/START domain